MIKIGILGEIGSGKSFVAKSFGHPVFNADLEVTKLYNKDKKIFYKLKKILPTYFDSFPIDKNKVIKAIMRSNKNLSLIVKIVHIEIKKKMKIFLKKNKNKKIVILDIPLLLENNLAYKTDILIFVEAKKKDILKRLIKRKNFDPGLLRKFRKIQLPLDYKKKKSQFIIKNDFTKTTVKKNINAILKKIQI